MYLIFSLVTLALIVFALVDVITSDDYQVKHLPKVGWILLIVFLPLIGSLVWLIAGKERSLPASLGTIGDPRRATETKPSTTETKPSTTEQELAALDREIEFHEKQAKLRRLEEEVERKRKGTSQG